MTQMRKVYLLRSQWLWKRRRRMIVLKFKMLYNHLLKIKSWSWNRNHHQARSNQRSSLYLSLHRVWILKVAVIQINSWLKGRRSMMNIKRGVKKWSATARIKRLLKSSHIRNKAVKMTQVKNGRYQTYASAPVPSQI